MKRILLVLVAVVFLAGLGWSQEEKAARPLGALCFEVGGSFVAPMGVGVEFFLGPVSLGAELRLFAWQLKELFTETSFWSITLDPGVAVRWFFSGLDSSMYLMAGASYVTAIGLSGEGSGTIPFGVLKPKAGVGYGALFGKDNRTRFAVELGAVYFVPFFEGQVINQWPITIGPHLLIMFGRAF
jgi:hypothetical protein